VQKRALVIQVPDQQDRAEDRARSIRKPSMIIDAECGPTAMVFSLSGWYFVSSANCAKALVDHQQRPISDANHAERIEPAKGSTSFGA